jgi:hypothetical protein
MWQPLSKSKLELPIYMLRSVALQVVALCDCSGAWG